MSMITSWSPMSHGAAASRMRLGPSTRKGISNSTTRTTKQDAFRNEPATGAHTTPAESELAVSENEPSVR